jgi:ABC-type uncharacterized transport system permease subunit
LKVNQHYVGSFCFHLQESKNKPSKKPAWMQMPSIAALLAICFHAGYLLGLFFDPEGGGSMFLRNVSLLSVDYMMLYPEQ